MHDGVQSEDVALYLVLFDGPPDVAAQFVLVFAAERVAQCGPQPLHAADGLLDFLSGECEFFFGHSFVRG